MALEGIDLLDLDRFQRLEHHEMFQRLRAEDPVYWHEDPGAQGFWNVVKHDDLVEVNRDTAHVLVGGRRHHRSSTRRVPAARPGGIDTRGVMMLVHGPAQAHALPAAREQGLHARA